MRQASDLPKLPPRAPDAHKGDFGRVLIVGGSAGMAGAASLAGQAALRSGAGLVTVACPAQVQPVAAAMCPCYTTRPLPQHQGALSTRAWPELNALLKSADVAAIGPGLGLAATTAQLVRRLAAQAPIPLVLDADALTALAQDTTPLHSAQAPRVLTPHPGEMARLAALPNPGAVQRDRLAVACAFAQRHRCVVVLKGQGTIVTDGDRFCVNATGNPGMATGGSGDVLTGVVAALIGQGLAPFEAAQLAVHVHGLAGDLAAGRLGQLSLTAACLLDALPQAFLSL